MRISDWSSDVCSSDLAGATFARAETVVFTDVNVVPMDRERVIPRTTVIVVDGMIASIGIKAKRPAGTKVIDGKGAWLVPGLADMHNHVTTRDDLALLLANGVTTMLNMGEATNSFRSEEHTSELQSLMRTT